MEKKISNPDELKIKFLLANKRSREISSDTEVVEKKLKVDEEKNITKSTKPNFKRCRAISMGNECKYPSCDRLHDVSLYLSTKPEDISEEKTGYCPAGFNCRFGNSHINKETNTLLYKHVDERTPFPEELNQMNIDLVQALRKKKYAFGAVGSLADKEYKPIEYKDKVYIAPLTTVGNLPFRRICIDNGADITTSEMAVCYNLLKGQSSEWALLRRHPSEKIFGIQVAGANSNALKEIGAVIRKEFEVDFVDFNAGCPIDVINKTGCGAALLQRQQRMESAVKGLLEGLQNVPLLLKTRISWDKDPILHEWIPKMPLWTSNGHHISALCIHGRTRAQRYSRRSDWNYISKCAEAMDKSIPVLGNGDIYSYEDYFTNTSLPGIKGAMIGRGVLIKPWLPTEIKEKRQWDISSSERFDILKNFVNYGLEHWGSDQKGVNTTRKFLLEWMSFLCRYVPVGLLDQPYQLLNQRVPRYIGRNDMETLMGSNRVDDWIRISEMLLGPVTEDYVFIPKHKSSAYSPDS